MRQYEITYYVMGSGAGKICETITASSEYDARRIVEAKYRGMTVQIVGARQVSF